MKKCPKCGGENLPQSEYCKQCWTPLASTPAAPALPTPSTVAVPPVIQSQLAISSPGACDHQKAKVGSFIIGAIFSMAGLFSGDGGGAGAEGMIINFKNAFVAGTGGSVISYGLIR